MQYLSTVVLQVCVLNWQTSPSSDALSLSGDERMMGHLDARGILARLALAKMSARSSMADDERDIVGMARYGDQSHPIELESSRSMLLSPAVSASAISMFWPNMNAMNMRHNNSIRTLGSSAFSVVRTATPMQDSRLHTALPYIGSRAPERFTDREPQGDTPLGSRTAILARPCDAASGLSNHQILLRSQIQVFQATLDDVKTHTRGRNKSIALGQVGIRCRYCAHLPAARRQKGAVYFPASVFGLYQAAQNMNTTHIQCGLCQAMPESAKTQCSRALAAKGGNSGAGRKYWAQSAAEMGLVDTEKGIFFLDDLPMNAKLADNITSGPDSTPLVDGITRKRKA
jgi:hypothetical protein